MKVPERKHLFIFAILSVLLLLILIPVFMYFSHDAKVLIKGYPHRTSTDDDARLIIRPNRPNGWTALSGISKYAQSAIVLSEDWSFYNHEGFDKEQMKVAIEEAAAGGRVRPDPAAA